MKNGVTWTGAVVFILGIAIEVLAGCAYRFMAGAIVAGAVAAVGLVTVGFGASTTKPMPR